MTKRARYRILLIAVLLIVLSIGAWYVWPREQTFLPSGGQVFSEKVLLDVPLFLQNDDRWAPDTIGESGSSMGSEGCVVSSVAMLLSYYGVDTDPKSLNAYLSRNGGYTDNGLLYWDKAAEMTDGRVEFAYAGPGSYELIDNNIKNGNPVIVKILINGAISHWVLVVGKEGRDYLINDPLSSDGKACKLSKYNSDIYGIRIYEPRAFN